MNILNNLKHQGYRLTTPRKEVLKVLEEYPHTAFEIYEAIQRNNVAIDLTSVYRSLEVFIKMNVVQEVELGEGKKRYELINQDHFHHHAICNNCKIIENILMQGDERVLRIPSNFKIEKYQILFFGLCSECQ